MNSNQLKMALALLDITHKEIAETLGISRVTIARVLNGKKHVSSTIIEKIKNHLEKQGIVFVPGGLQYQETIVRRR
jgi:plasmid maintenance system antidote protein VapI